MFDRDHPHQLGSERALGHSQEAQQTPVTEPAMPIRQGDTSVEKSAHSSPHKSPLSALRTGEGWTTNTIKYHLGASPSVRGPSFHVSPMCSRVAATSPGEHWFFRLQLHFEAWTKHPTLCMNIVHLCIHDCTHHPRSLGVNTMCICRPRQRVGQCRP